MNPLVQNAFAQLNAAGFENVELIREVFDDRHFGNAEAVFKVGQILMRFVRERGQDFIDLASGARPDKFHQIDDVEIAMGWKSMDQVLVKREPEDLSSVLGRLSQRFGQLEGALSGDRERFTRARIFSTAKERGATFVKRLQR